jgi:hypothetical protein
VSGLDSKLADVARQYDDLQTELARPEVSMDSRTCGESWPAS